MTGEPLLPSALLRHWIKRQASPAAWAWFETGSAAVATGNAAALDTYFTRMPRQLGRDDLRLDPDDLADADRARPGWNPRHWSLDEAARIALLLSLPGDVAPALKRLRVVADPTEQIALLRGLPLYPHAPDLMEEAAQGVRTAMLPVFEAVAHHNPYPRENFDLHRWNQMVLKALFIGSTLAPIDGLIARANADLAVMLRDYARERRAAGRTVSGELWFCLAPFAEAVDAVSDLIAAARSNDPAERAGARQGLESLDAVPLKESL